jgi:hypothetical protein
MQNLGLRFGIKLIRKKRKECGVLQKTQNTSPGPFKRKSKSLEN